MFQVVLSIGILKNFSGQTVCGMPVRMSRPTCRILSCTEPEADKIPIRVRHYYFCATMRLLCRAGIGCLARLQIGLQALKVFHPDIGVPNARNLRRVRCRLSGVRRVNALFQHDRGARRIGDREAWWRTPDLGHFKAKLLPVKLHGTMNVGDDENRSAGDQIRRKFGFGHFRTLFAVPGLSNGDTVAI